MNVMKEYMTVTNTALTPKAVSIVAAIQRNTALLMMENPVPVSDL